MAQEISGEGPSASQAATPKPAATPKTAVAPKKQKKRQGSKFASPVFVTIVLVVGVVFRYLVDNLVREDFNNKEGIWDSATSGTILHTVLVRGTDTNGQSCTVEVHQLSNCKSGFYTDKPGSHPLHYHVTQAKTIVVKQGVVGYLMNTTEGSITAGNSITFPAGMPHTFWNADNTTAVTYDIVLSPCPAGNEALYENIAALSAMSGSYERINPLQLLITFKHFQIRVAELPDWLATMVDSLLCPLGELLGLKPTYPRYTSLKRGEAPAASTDAADADAAAAAGAEAMPEPEPVPVPEAVPEPEPVPVVEEPSAEVEAAAEAQELLREQQQEAEADKQQAANDHSEF